MAFFKYQDGLIHIAPNFVIAPTFELHAASHNQYSYPIWDWYWFDTDEDAYTFFNVPPTVDT